MKLSSLLSLAPLLAAGVRAQATTAAAAAAATASSAAGGLSLVVTDSASIKAAAKIVSQNLRALYPDKESWFIPGQFGLIDDNQNLGYYWWEAGAAMGAWVDYWAYTGDDQYNDMVSYALLFQTGNNDDYQPKNQTLSLGNDDQAFWGIAAMSAAERGFPNPPKDKPQWLALAQAVFNSQVARWETATCQGGIRWQVVPTNEGYNYKNTISNGLLFNLGARLAHYTGNQTYADWSEKIYKWTQDLKLLDSNYNIYDGVHIPACTVQSGSLQWTYTLGVYMSGAAFLYDFYNDTTKKTTWQTETMHLINGTAPFINQDSKYAVGVIQESACEFATSSGDPSCNTDQRSFKGYLARFLGYTYQVAPFARDQVLTILKTSAAAAAEACSGTVDGSTNVCGLSWRKRAYDGAPYGIAKGGVGENMGAMEVIQALMVADSSVAGPVTAVKGGTSVGNVNAGTNSQSDLTSGSSASNKPTTTADKAGAGILTTMTLGALIGLTYWLVRE